MLPNSEKWECYECNKKFRSPSGLQRHYALHLAQHQQKMQNQPQQPEEALENEAEGDAVSDITEATGGESYKNFSFLVNFVIVLFYLMLLT